MTRTVVGRSAPKSNRKDPARPEPTSSANPNRSPRARGGYPERCRPTIARRAAFSRKPYERSRNVVMLQVLTRCLGSRCENSEKHKFIDGKYCQTRAESIKLISCLAETDSQYLVASHGRFAKRTPTPATSKSDFFRKLSHGYEICIALRCAYSAWIYTC